MHNFDTEADEILREWARKQGISLRQAGIIDERRNRTIREREINFATFFGNKKRRAESR